MKKERTVVEYYCDVCGKKLPDDYSHYRQSTVYQSYAEPPVTKDLCHDCDKLVRHILSGSLIMINVDEVTVESNTLRNDLKVHVDGCTDFIAAKFTPERVSLDYILNGKIGCVLV